MTQNNSNYNTFSKVYYNISDISNQLGIPQSTLRYWEEEFKQIQPMRGPGKRRIYTLNDITIIKRIQKLLYHDNLSIDEAKTAIQGIKKRDLIKLHPNADELLKRINNALADIEMILKL